jgi:cobalt-zinc-cadmium efflux system membrane fusion protein
MTLAETERPPHEPSASPDALADREQWPGARGRGMTWRWVGIILVLGIVVGAYFSINHGLIPRTKINQTLAYLQERVTGKNDAPDAGLQERSTSRAETVIDGSVGLENSQAKAIGLGLVEVKAQHDPIKLELTGRTAYDPNSLAKVRSRFDALVEKVHVELGQRIQKGAPLVDLFSTELAKAKNDYQTKYVQWQHDLRLLRLKGKLVANNAISQQNYVDAQNDESKSRLDYTTAGQTLRVLGVPEAEIEPLIATLGDVPKPEQLLNVAEKARMTMHSLVDGIIISRDVVPGNLYDETNVLLTIAPLEHLWVLANVYEVDQAKVALGQRMEIRFPFLQQTTHGTVEHVSSEVSRETRAVQIRASILNPGGKLKSDMLVKVTLEVPPVKGQTNIPRQALVVINGAEYVFVKRAHDGQGKDRFERRKVSVAQENSDFVVVATGLEAGETVASSGSLILAQLYEDLQMVQTGMPVQ